MALQAPRPRDLTSGPRYSGLEELWGQARAALEGIPGEQP